MRLLFSLLFALVALGALVVTMNLRDEDKLDDTAAPLVASAEQVRLGDYLVRAGNCGGCHTARGGAPFAGGRAIETPFGTVYATNLTPDASTGLGRWTRAEFWRALHNGRSKDGRLLYPAFPYPSYTNVNRGDADAMFAYLRSLAPVTQPNRRHDLRFPYDSQAALAIWRALFFRPGVFENAPGKPAAWNRGAYLVQGLGHCNECHGGRNFLGATPHTLELNGGLIPMQNWFAPPLSTANSVAGWDTPDVVALITGGVSRRGTAMGPMAEVVYRSTQYLTDEDAAAIAIYLKTLQHAAAPASEALTADPALVARGTSVYDDHCADCHGKAGEGNAPAYPPLAGNLTVTLDSPANAIRAVVNGGYAPSTTGNPRPYGMPPFRQVLSEADIAAVLSYVRGAWGNRAGAVRTFEVQRYW